MTSPFEKLGIPDAATADEIKAAWRRIAFANHPDRGGDVETFRDYEHAYRNALHIAARRKCERCGGTGRVTTQVGFTSLKSVCPDCRGKIS